MKSSSSNFMNLFVVVVVAAAMLSTTSVNADWVNTLFNELTVNGLAESTPIDFLIGRISFVSLTGGTLVYSTTSPYFKVDPSNGDVRLANQLSYKSMPSFPVVFSVVIEGRMPIYTQVTVNVRPVNHNPKFDSNPYRFSVKDNVNVGALLYSDMNVIDGDTGPNGTVTVSCDVTSSPQASNICSYFTFSQSNISGFPDRSRISIILAKRLDFNFNYSFYLIARDQGNPSLTDSTNVIITVENSQDSRPIFIGTPYFVNVPELGNDLSTSLMSFQVRDARPPGPGNSLQLTIEGDTKNWFTLGYPSLNGDTYTVQLRRNSPNINLDENSQRSRYAINIKATQMVNNQLSSIFSMTTINVNIIDINNNAPIFSQSSYTANVSEGLVYLATVAGVSIVVTDLDLQDNAYFELSLNHLPPLQPGIFQVSPTFGQGSVAAALQVAKPEFIRYDVMKTMNLTIVAREMRTAERRSSTASITIYITSPNNHAPYFPNILNPISIFDDTPVYTQISSYIRAQDDDPGDNGKITYKIISTDNSDKYFSIDPNSGILTLSSPLSYSVQSTFLFQVQATDGGGLTATTSILINIKDHNFNYPVFDSDSYITYVPEGTTDMQPRVTVRAALRPMISDRVYYYQFGPGISQLINTTFRVNPSTGSITMLQPVDFNRTPNKQGYFDIPVTCGVVNYPEIPIGHTNVRVYIMDSNNHPPVFTNPNYQSITIPETTKPDTNVTRVTATDEDTGDFGKIVYYIETGSRDDFVVDPFTGDIKVTRQPNLKPEQNYNITVIARDSGQPPLSATTFVAIIITDSISHNPVFSPNQYTYVIIENTPANTLVGTLSANSQDKRAKLSYSFIYNTWKVYKNDQEVSASVADWFSIDQDTGTIKIRNPFIQYSQSDKVTVNVTVRVTNPDNVNDVLSAIAPVTILILPIAQSSDKVVFSPAADDFNFQMIEKQPVNTPLYNFAAFYLKDSSQIRNFILTENPGTPRGYFMIDGSTGALRVSKVINYLDLPSSKNLTYKVKATAQPPSTAYALANVTINILPLNGEKPIFVNGNYIFRVNSTQPTGTTIGVISATCPYGSSPTPVVTYQLITNSDYFYIDQNNGTIVLTKRLDSADSTQLLYNLIAQAHCVDLKTTSTALIQVYVTPIKTLAPVFTNIFYRFPASAGYTGLLGQVLAYDPNPFNKSSIVYTILRVSPVEDQAFTINSTTGVINVTSVLPKQDKNYTIVVQAADSSIPPLTNTTMVNVEVTQLSSTHPEFVDFNPIVNVYQEQNPNDPVVIFKTGGTQKVNFTMVSNGNTKFYVNPNTGELMINGTITRGEVYEMVIIATNGLYSSSKALTVNVFSEAPPSFICKQPRPFQLFLKNSTGPLDPSLGLQTNTDCSYDMPGTVFLYNINAVSYNGMNIDPKKSIFSIGRDGTINVGSNGLTNLDDGKYRLTISVKKQNSSVENTLDTIVRITGWDTMAPKFDSMLDQCRGSGLIVKTGILDLTPFNTPVVQLLAGDCDPPPFRNNVYQITSTQPKQLYTDTFYGENSDYTDRLAFHMNPDTGLVSTNYPDFRNYYRSFFDCDVSVRRASASEVTSNAKLLVYILRETSKYKIVFNKSSEQIRPLNQDLTDQLNAQLKARKYELIADPVSTYIDDNGNRIAEKSSMCYFILDNSLSPSMPITDASTVASIMNGINVPSTFNVDKFVESCFSRRNLTTRWWSDKWFLWFILIAFSILVFVVALILSCCVCFYWPMNVKKISKARPYVVLDDRPMSAAGSVFDYGG